MRMYETVTKNSEKVEKVLCNCCGKEIKKEGFADGTVNRTIRT